MANDRHNNTIERSIADNECDSKPMIYNFELADVICSGMEHKAQEVLCKRLGTIKGQKKAGSI